MRYECVLGCFGRCKIAAGFWLLAAGNWRHMEVEGLKGLEKARLAWLFRQT